MKPYVSIDIETTGLNPEEHQILEVGAVIDDGTRPVGELATFQCYVLHKTIVGDPFALAMNHEILRRIASPHKYEGYQFLLPHEVPYVLASFLVGQGMDPMHIVPAGKNFSGFDHQFLKRLPNFRKYLNFKHRAIDPGMLYWHPETDNEPPSMKTCLERAGIEGEVSHTAIEDSIDVIKLVREHANRRRVLDVPNMGDIQVTIEPPVGVTARDIAYRLTAQFQSNGQFVNAQV